MFSKNEKISLHQINRLLVLDLFASGSLVLPKFLSQMAGRTGLMTIMALFIFIGIYLWILLLITGQFKKSYACILQKAFGKFGKNTILLIYQIKFFISFVFIFKMFIDNLKMTLLVDFSEWAIVMTFSILTFYSVSKGIETRGRMGELIFYIVFIPILLLFIFGAGSGKLGNLAILEANGAMPISKIWRNGFLACAFFTPVDFILFAKPSEKTSKNRQRCCAVFSGVFVGICLCVILYILCVYVLSLAGMKNEAWPVVILLQLVRIPGGFVSRWDGLMLSFWIFAMEILLGAYLGYLTRLSESMCSKAGKSQIMVFWLLAVVAAIWWFDQPGQIWDMYLWVMFYIGMPLTFVIPTVAGVIVRCCQKNKSEVIGE